MQDESRFDDASELLEVFAKFKPELVMESMMKRVFNVAVQSMMEVTDVIHQQTGRTALKGKIRTNGMEWAWMSQRRADGVQQFAIDGEWWPADFNSEGEG